MNKSITLIQPRHNYAAKEWLWHIYLSSPLLSFKSRVLSVLPEQKIDFIDANFDEPYYSKLQWIVWINLVWAPYIPEVIKIIEKLSNDVNIILWWQIVSSLTEKEFNKIFNNSWKKVINWNIDENIENLLNLEKWSIPKVEEINLIDSYKDISNEHMKEYLSREFSIYLSQWCKYNCNFCQAVKWKPEIYRDLNLFKDELLYISNRAISLWINSIKFYLSNLDILQTPINFDKFLDIVLEVKKETWIQINFRWLCGVESFLYMYDNYKDMLIKAKNIWLSSIGFWIDWATPEVWKSIWKWQNYKSIWNETKYTEQEKSLEVIKLTRWLWITPETLMVFWHPSETAESLETAYNFSREMYEKYGSIPRPHISKNIIPWAKEWYDDKNSELVNLIVDNPEFFQALDFTALPSELTHPDKNLRRLSRKWYKKICNLDTNNSTKFVYPDTPEYRKIANRLWLCISELNIWKFDR